MSRQRRLSRSATVDVAIMIILFALLLGLIISGTSAGTNTKSLDRWTPSDQEALDGEQLYGFACASCHGANLEGGEGPKLGRGSDAIDYSDNAIAEAVFMGERDMPSLQGTLTSNQVQSITDFIRTVQTG